MTVLGCPKLDDDLTALRVPELRAMLFVCENKKCVSSIEKAYIYIYIYIYIYYRRCRNILY